VYVTALKPIENRRVRGVASERYPLNEKCAHPTCTEPTADPHHCFPRSQVGNDSWFVEIESDSVPDPDAIPHVTGLCRSHHDAVEEHNAWIRLEDGKFVWYDRHSTYESERDGVPPEWREIGPLNPQPGSREGKPKRRPFKGEQRRNRATITIRVPLQSEEDGAGLLEDLHTQVEERLGHDPPRPFYYAAVDSMNYLLLNHHDDE
jgi:hypothetical protein